MGVGILTIRLPPISNSIEQLNDSHLPHYVACVTNDRNLPRRGDRRNSCVFLEDTNELRDKLRIVELNDRFHSEILGRIAKVRSSSSAKVHLPEMHPHS